MAACLRVCLPSPAVLDLEEQKLAEELMEEHAADEEAAAK